MVNPGRGEVALVVEAGVFLTLRFTTSALSSLQHAMGFAHSAEGCALFLKRLAQHQARDWGYLLSFGIAPHREAFTPAAALGLLAKEGAIPAASAESRVAAIGTAIRLAFPEPSSAPAEKGEPFTWDLLLASALHAGMTLHQFWSSTPREVAMVVRASVRRRNDATTMAWLNAAWSQQGKRMPSLDTFLLDDGSTTKQAATDAQLFRLAQLMGGCLVDKDGNVLVDAGSVVGRPN